MAAKRTIESIRKRLQKAEAVVMTASELCDAVRSGRKVSLEDVDVVTCATKGLMSGTMAILSFPVAEQNSFLRAVRVWMNGVPCFPGPAPNERLGIVDLCVYGTQHGRDDPRYGGGHLFRDLVERKEIAVEVETSDGRRLEASIDIDEMPFARLMGVRNAFRNYMAFVNPGEQAVESIFAVRPLKGSLAEASACGCGEINPLQNDPKLRVIGVGTSILLNGALGTVIGQGTRASPEKPNLSAIAEMHGMSPRYMGGFQTSAGPEVICSWAVPIPVTSQSVLDALTTLDGDVELKVADISGRKTIARTSYADLWQGTDRAIAYDAEGCRGYRSGCPDCPPQELCPTGAFSLKSEGIDHGLCFNCGTCKVYCRGQKFRGELGELDVNGTKVPIVLRQSDRLNAERLALELKKKITAGEFQITPAVRKIEIR